MIASFYGFISENKRRDDKFQVHDLLTMAMPPYDIERNPALGLGR